MTMENQRPFPLHFGDMSYANPQTSFANPWPAPSQAQPQAIYPGSQTPSAHGADMSQYKVEQPALSSTPQRPPSQPPSRSGTSSSGSMPPFTHLPGLGQAPSFPNTGHAAVLPLRVGQVSSPFPDQSYTASSGPTHTSYPASTAYELGFGISSLRPSFDLHADARRFSPSSMPSSYASSSRSSSQTSISSGQSGAVSDASTAASDILGHTERVPMLDYDFDHRRALPLPSIMPNNTGHAAAAAVAAAVAADVADDRKQFADALEASHGMISMSQETPRNIYGNRAGGGPRGSGDSYGFPTTANSSASSVSSSGFAGGYYGSVGSVSDYSTAGSDPEGVPRAGVLSRPASDLSTVSSIPPAPRSMMGQFSSRVSNNQQKKHVCKVCDKRFTRPSSLQTHMYSHTGEKPYACKHAGCGRHFSVVSNLRRHRKVHKKKDGMRSGYASDASTRTDNASETSEDHQVSEQDA